MKFWVRAKNLLNRIKNYNMAKSQELVFYKYVKNDNDFSVDTSIQVKKIVDADDYRKFCYNNKFDIHLEYIKRLEHGSKLYILIKNGQIVSSGWLAFKECFWIAENDAFIDMKNSDEAILYDFETAEAFRGNGYYGKLLQYMILDEKSIFNFLIYAKVENMSSRRGIVKVGFKEDGIFSKNQSTYIEYLKKNGFIYLGNRYRFCGLSYTRKI